MHAFAPYEACGFTTSRCNCMNQINDNSWLIDVGVSTRIRVKRSDQITDQSDRTKPVEPNQELMVRRGHYKLKFSLWHQIDKSCFFAQWWLRLFVLWFQFWYCKEYSKRMGVEETGYNYHLDLDCSQLANDMNIETCICVSAYYQSSGSTFQGGPSSNSSPLETTSHHHNYLAPSPTPAYDSGVDSTHASTPTNKSR